MTAKDRDLIEAVEDGRKNDVILLVRNGACVNACKQETGDSVLAIACEKGYTDIAKILIEFGAETAICNATGESALHAAVSRDNIEAINLLHTKGADFNCADNNGLTPLHLAVNKDFIRSTKRLLKYGANPNVCEKGFNRGPLHDAVRHRDFRTAQMLLEKDALVNLQDMSGATPLHEAVSDNNLHVARLLLKYGADINMRESIGRLTPFQAARSREMRHLLTLFAHRASRDSSRSSDVDSGTQSMHGSYDNILGDTSSLHGSRESLFSLPAIKLNENLPYDAEAERKLIRRIRSRSVEKPTLVEFSTHKAKKSRSFERDLNKIDVLDKTQFISRGRRQRPRKRVPVTPYRAHSLESLYDVSKGSLRGYRFSWSPNRGRSRSNSHEKYVSTRDYTEPPLKPFKSKQLRDFVHNSDYMEPQLVELDVRVVVNPKHGAPKDEGVHSDGESGISTPSTAASPADKRKHQRSEKSDNQNKLDVNQNRRDQGQYGAQPSRANAASKSSPNEYLATGVTTSHELPHVHSLSTQRDVTVTHSNVTTTHGDVVAMHKSDIDTSDDDILETYEEELNTKKRPVRIYSSIEDLSIVAADGKGMTLKDDDEDAVAVRKRVSRLVEHKITKMNRHQHPRTSRMTSEEIRDSDRSELSVDGPIETSPLYSPILRQSPPMSDLNRSQNSEMRFSSTPRTSADGNFTMTPKGFLGDNDAINSKQSHTIYTSHSSSPPEPIKTEVIQQVPVVVKSGTNVHGASAGSNLERQHGANSLPLAATITTTTKQAPDDGALNNPDAIDRSSYVENMVKIRKSFEAATDRDRLAPQTANITNTLHVKSFRNSGSYEAMEQEIDRDSSPERPPMFVRQESFEVPETPDVKKSSNPIRPSQKALVSDSVQSHDVHVHVLNNGGPEPVQNAYSDNASIRDNQIETESEISQDEYTSLHVSIRDQMYLQDPQTPDHLKRKRGSLTPVGSIIRKEFDIGRRSDSELEEEYVDQPNEQFRFTHYDVTEPLKPSQMKAAEMQPTSTQNDDVTSDETLTSGDESQTELGPAIENRSNPETMNTKVETDRVVETDFDATPNSQNLRDVMKSKFGGTYQLGMTPMQDETTQSYMRTNVQTDQHESSLPTRFDPNTTDSELSDIERGRDNLTTDDDEAMHAQRISGVSSPEPEWDRTYTYDDDALLHGQPRKHASRTSSKVKTSKKRSSKAPETDKLALNVDQDLEYIETQDAQITGAKVAHNSAQVQPDVVAQETDSLHAGAHDDVTGDQLVTSSYGAFDMYEKPAEQLNDSAQNKESSVWNRICGCCYNFGLYG